MQNKFFYLCILFIFIFSLLGSWQTYRYFYKKSLMTLFETEGRELPKPFDIFTLGPPKEFQSVAVDGFYVNAFNVFIPRQYKDQLGFDVVTPLKLKNAERLLLINRGWIAKPTKGFPILRNVDSEVHVTGYIKFLNQYQFILGKNTFKNNSDIVMQKIDTQELKTLTGHLYYPFLLRLDPFMPDGFIRDWQIVSMSPGRHLGYALQWFLLALVIMIGSAIFRRDNRNES